MVALFVVLTIIVFLTLDYVVQRAELRRARGASPAGDAAAALAPIAASPACAPALPRGVFLDHGHTWAALEPSGTLRVGADPLPAILLGRPEAVELVAGGTEVARGEPIARLRRQGRELTLRAPADGVIAAANPGLAADPAQVARDPFGAWLVELMPRRVGAAVRTLLVGEEAAAWLGEELARLRDTVASLDGNAAAVAAGPTLPDGGQPIEGLADLLDGDGFNQVTVAFLGSWRSER
jgi:glycine cleavage system H lipoate-binding protein